MNKLTKYVFIEKAIVLPTIFSIVILGIVAPLRSFVFQKIIDSISIRNLILNVTFGVGFSAIVFAVEYASKIGLAKFLMVTNLSLRRDVFASVINQNIRDFNKSNTAEYISSLTNDLKILNDDYFSLLYEVMLQGILFIVATVLIAFISPLLLLIVLIISIFPILLPKLLSFKLRSTKADNSNRMSNYVSYIKDVFSGFEVVKTFSIEDKIFGAYNDKNYLLSKSEYNSNKTFYLAQTLSSIINNISFIFVIAVSIHLVINGNITVGYMVAITQMMNFIMTPAKTISQNISKIKSTEAIQDKIAMLIEKKSVINGETVISELKSSIEFKNVYFSLENKEILNNINLILEKGKKYAIVGASGSGKSTLIKLLLRYYDEFEGKILIDGMDNRNIANESLFNVCPIIHQNVFVFNDTLKNNISLYNDYSDEEIRLAIKTAGIEEMVSDLQNDMHEVIDENGNNFSGGEKQRISIARALVKSPSVIILDEATSSLDNETAYQIEKSIINIPDITSIVITHKYNDSLLKQYDKIIALKKGHIVEEGSFDELLSSKGYFYSLYSIANSSV